MKIDKNLLSQLAKLDDKSLSAAIKMVAASSGIDIGADSFDHAHLEVLRKAMQGATDEDLENAKKLFEGYKKQ